MTPEQLLALLAALLPDNQQNRIRAADLRAALTALVEQRGTAPADSPEQRILRHSFFT